MSTQRIFWYLAAVAAMIAALVVTSRKAGERMEKSVPTQAISGEEVARTLEQLQNDSNMDKTETKQAVSAVASAAEHVSQATAESLYLLGVWRMSQRQLEGAEKAFRDSISLRDDWALPYNELGILLANHALARWEEAEQAFRNAIRLAPEWGRPHNDLAILLRIVGRMEEAEPEALTALRLSPNDIAAHNNYANLLVYFRRYDEAEPHYQEAIRLEPNHPKPYYNLGCLYALQNRNEEAISLLTQAIELDPSLKEDALADQDLETLRNDARFGRILENTATPEG
jgi:Flp pilus assembly protein TadD